MEITFDAIVRLSAECRYKDCTHTVEEGCAVLEAIEQGELDSSSYVNYLKLKREKEHFTVTVAEKRKKEKAFGKILKDYHKLDMKRKNVKL
jgi:ribosome biogenesis GTPase